MRVYGILVKNGTTPTIHHNRRTSSHLLTRGQCTAQRSVSIFLTALFWSEEFW